MIYLPAAKVVNAISSTAKMINSHRRVRKFIFLIFHAPLVDLYGVDIHRESQSFIYGCAQIDIGLAGNKGPVQNLKLQCLSDWIRIRRQIFLPSKDNGLPVS